MPTTIPNPDPVSPQDYATKHYVDSTGLGTPYFPPQSPPGTGITYFTDSSGAVWVSNAGAPWKRAQELVKAHWYLATGINQPSWSNPFPFDTKIADPLSLVTASGANQGAFICPIAGDYLVVGTMSVNTTNAVQLVQAFVVRGTSTIISYGLRAWNTATGLLTSQASAVVPGCAVNDQLAIGNAGQNGVPVQAGRSFTSMSIQYLHP